MVKIYISAVIFFCFGMVAAAQDYNGLCFPGDGCTGIVPINDGTFFTCEENCVMEEATLIRGMDALLFDVTCRGDSGAYSYRMMLARIMTDEGLATFAVTNDAITPLDTVPRIAIMEQFSAKHRVGFQPTKQMAHGGLEPDPTRTP